MLPGSLPMAGRPGTCCSRLRVIRGIAIIRLPDRRLDRVRRCPPGSLPPPSGAAPPGPRPPPPPRPTPPTRRVPRPPLRDYEYAKKLLAVAELFTTRGNDLRTRPELFGSSLRYRIIAGGLVRAEEYILAMRQRTDLARAMQAVMATVDVMM